MQSKFRPKRTVRKLSRVRPTALPLLPPLPQRRIPRWSSLTQTPAKGKFDLPNRSNNVLATTNTLFSYLTVEGNAGDRNNLDPWHNGNELVKSVAAANKNVIVVVHSVGPIILETILAQPSVKAIVWAGLPGQESGNALVDVMYGTTSPSGKLPYTIAKQPSDYGAGWNSALVDNFVEDLFIDYRHFDKNGIAPRYEFGYGLSYTTFNYSGLRLAFLPQLGHQMDPLSLAGRKNFSSRSALSLLSSRILAR